MIRSQTLEFTGLKFLSCHLLAVSVGELLTLANSYQLNPKTRIMYILQSCYEN